MNTRDLSYAVAIAETGNFARAARRCNVSQSTLSIQIRKLEESLGAPIFERTTKSLRVTRLGESILRSARLILDEEAHLRQIAAAQTPFAGDLHIGAFPTLAPYLFPRLLPKLKRAFPELRPLLVEEKTGGLIRLLRDGSLDCALLALPVEEPDLEQQAIFWEPFFLALPEAHRLAGRRSVAPEELRDEEILLLDEGHCLRGQTLTLCARIGAGESRSYRATSLETLRNLVAAGSGITIIPKLAVPATPQPGLRYIPFTAPAPGRSIGLVWRRMSKKNAFFGEIARVLSLD